MKKNEIEPKYDMFVSYSPQDMAFVDELVRRLKSKNQRLKIWFDRGVLRLGDSFSSGVQEALEQSKYFLLVISPGYLDSSWANFEMGVALSRAGSSEYENIIPLVIGDVNLAALPPPITRNRLIRIGENVRSDKLAVEKLVEDLTARIELAEKSGHAAEEKAVYTSPHPA
ncbi:MAG: toll/interleukin-1 receptor domain-containing protein [Blastocatellia bacterium]